MDPVDVVEEVYDAFARRDLVDYLALLDPDVVWIQRDGLPYQGVRRGRDAVMREVFEPVTMDWRRFELIREHISADGARVLVNGRYSGELMVTGHHVAGRFVHVLLVRNDRVAEVQLFAYPAAALNALDGAD